MSFPSFVDRACAHPFLLLGTPLLGCSGLGGMRGLVCADGSAMFPLLGGEAGLLRPPG